MVAWICLLKPASKVDCDFSKIAIKRGGRKVAEAQRSIFFYLNLYPRWSDVSCAFFCNGAIDHLVPMRLSAFAFSALLYRYLLRVE